MRVCVCVTWIKHERAAHHANGLLPGYVANLILLLQELMEPGIKKQEEHDLTGAQLQSLSHNY